MPSSETERLLRAQAHMLWSRGVMTWDQQLRANGLDPYTWSHGAPTGIPAPSRHRRADFSQPWHRSAPLQPASFSAADNSVECLWTTGASVLRSDWDGTFSEVLDVTPQAVRLGRLNLGAPFLNSHQLGDLRMVLGTVVPNSAKIADGKGTCRIALSTSAENAGIVEDIKGGRIRNVSVGYNIKAVKRTEAQGKGIAEVRVTDWEPFEISAVAAGADALAQIK